MAGLAGLGALSGRDLPDPGKLIYEVGRQLYKVAQRIEAVKAGGDPMIAITAEAEAKAALAVAQANLKAAKALDRRIMLPPGMEDAVARAERAVANLDSAVRQVVSQGQMELTLPPPSPEKVYGPSKYGPGGRMNPEFAPGPSRAELLFQNVPGGGVFYGLAGARRRRRRRR